MPGLPGKLPNAPFDAMNTETIRLAIANSYFAQSLSEEGIEALVGIATLREFEDGATIMSQDEDEHDVMILVEGKAAIFSFTQSMTPNERISYVQIGQPFGEVALFDRGRRSAIVRSEGSSKVVVMDGEALLALFDQDCELARVVQGNLIRVLCERLRTTTRQLAMYIALDVIY